ncbi:MAG: hypothetical protein WCM93_06145, partial [Bacteroidota bacterium]
GAARCICFYANTVTKNCELAAIRHWLGGGVGNSQKTCRTELRIEAEILLWRWVYEGWQKDCSGKPDPRNEGNAQMRGEL